MTYDRRFQYSDCGKLLAFSEDFSVVCVGDVFRAYLNKLAGEIPVGLTEEVVVE